MRLDTLHSTGWTERDKERKLETQTVKCRLSETVKDRKQKVMEWYLKKE